MELIIDNHHGVYIPQLIAESGLLSAGGIDAESVEILMQGPDHEWYWDTWDTVLNNFRTEKMKSYSSVNAGICSSQRQKNGKRKNNTNPAERRGFFCAWLSPGIFIYTTQPYQHKTDKTIGCSDGAVIRKGK